MKRVITLLVFGLLAALLPGPAQADTAVRQLVVHSVQADPTYTGLCRGAENGVKVTAQLTYTGPGETYLRYEVSDLQSAADLVRYQQDQDGSGTVEFLVPVPESGTRQITVVGMMWNGDGGWVDNGQPVQVTISRTCQDAQVTVEAATDFQGLCGSEVTTPIKAVITSPIAQTVTYEWRRSGTGWGSAPLPGNEPQTLVFDGPGSREIAGVLLRTRTGSTNYHLAITAPASYRGPNRSSVTTCATPPVDIATVSELNYDGPCGPDFSTPLRAKITSGKGTTRYQWVDENEQPLLGSGVQTVQITENDGTQYVDGPRLPRQRPAGGKVALLFLDLSSTPLMSGLAAWSTTCRPLATPNLTQVEFTSEQESCELPKPAIFTLKGSITALGPGPIRYAYARKSAQTNNAWVRDPWTSLTLTSAGTVDVSKQWTVPTGRRGEQGYWRLEIDEPYASVSGQARYWFYCPD